MGVHQSFQPELLQRFARDVAVLWDEAQDNPTLLRFLAPFGRPDLGRIERVFESAREFELILAEIYPVYATWLAALLVRAGVAERAEHPALSRRGNWLEPSLSVTGVVEVHAGDKLVVAGSLDARNVVVRGGVLVVAGDVRCEVMVADGCVVIGGALSAALVGVPAERLPQVTDAWDNPQALALQVAQQVTCRVYDVARLALACPVKADVVVHALGVPVTPGAAARLQATLVPSVLGGDGVDFREVVSRLSRDLPVLVGPARE